MAFVTDAGRYNRPAIMKEARRVYRLRRDKGMTFADALRFAWGRAKEMRDQRRAELASFKRLYRAA